MARLDVETTQPVDASELVPGNDLSERLARFEPPLEGPKTDEPLPAPAGGELLNEQPPTEILPDWLESLKNKASDSGGLLTGEEEIPDWLAALPVIPADGSLPDPKPEPDWMNDLKGATGEASSSNLPPLPPAESLNSPGSDEEDAVAAWEQKANSVFTDEPSASEGTAEEIPDWLSDLKTGGEAKDEEELPLKNVVPLAEIPGVGPEETKLDWLTELVKIEDTSQSDSSDTGQGEDSVFSEEETPNAANLETPEWISKLAMESSEEIEASVSEGECR